MGGDDFTTAQICGEKVCKQLRELKEIIPSVPKSNCAQKNNCRWQRKKSEHRKLPCMLLANTRGILKLT